MASKCARSSYSVTYLPSTCPSMLIFNVLTVQLAYKSQLILRHVSIHACAFTYRFPKTVHWKTEVESDQQKAGILYTLHERRYGSLQEICISL